MGGGKGGGHGNSGRIDSFVQTWGLDEIAAKFLAELDVSVLEKVLLEFAPRDDTHDVSGKMFAFARSVAAKQGAESIPPTMELLAFAERWSLGSQEVAWLAELPPMVSSVLVREFDPKEDTQNVTGKMKSFARSIQTRASPSSFGRSSGNAFAGLALNPRAAPWSRAPAGPRGLQNRLADFVNHWGVEDSLPFLSGLDDASMATIMEQFDPKGDTKNINGRLRAFARSIQAGMQGRLELEQFAAHWNLDDSTVVFLQSLPQEVTATVLQEFAPDPATRDIAGKLKMFARSVLNRTACGLPKPREDSWTDGADAGHSTDTAIRQFAAQWALNHTSVEFLETLPPEVRAKVFEEFAPRSDTRDVGAKLRVFAGTVMNGKGTRPARAEVALKDELSLPATEEAFLAHWGLDVSTTARDVLNRMQPGPRARVMQEFAPGQDTVDVLGKFCGFASSVARTKGAPPAGRAPSRDFGRSSGGAVQQYCEQWQLDESSFVLLRNMEPHVQAAVMAEFQPRSDVRDMSGKFSAFARSVAARIGSSGPQKRHMPPLLNPMDARRPRMSF